MQPATESLAFVSFPHVRCARCGTHMRLSEISPDIHEQYQVKFACTCGFDYQMSAPLDEKRAM
jgi:hypothetical protein